MSVTTVPPKETFRIDMLWNDSRYRSTFLQIIALFVTLIALLYLVNNVRDNLADLGKEFGFTFMTTPASYDINQQPIDYTSRDSHARASVIGMLNTLIVAVVGCFLATIIGVLAGVARLSKNWIVRQLMGAYVEVVRNIPVLIQILLVMAVINETLPQPRDFRGDDAVASMIFSESVAVTNRGTYIPAPAMGDLAMWVVGVFILSIIAIVVFGRWRTAFQHRTGEEIPAVLDKLIWPAAAVVGILTAYVLYRIGGLDWLSSVGHWLSSVGHWLSWLGFDLTSFSSYDILSQVAAVLLAGGVAFAVSRVIGAATATVILLLIVPSTLVFFLLGQPITLEYPELKGFNFRGGVHLRDSYVALTLALAIYTGAFIAENVRAGIQAVSNGQTEAAFALGLQPGRTMSLVILPQALRIIIPPMISQYLNLTKNSSLALLVGYMDATGTLGGITLNQTGKEFETLFLLMAFYLSVSLSIAAVMNLYNENTKLVERTSAIGGGFSFLNFFDSMNGQWELLKKGDAKMRPGYGIRGVLNLFVLFYAVTWVLLLNYVFIERATDLRPGYFEWSTFTQLAALGMIAMSFAALITCLFKSPRFVDMAFLELVVFVIGILAGFQFGLLTDWVSGAGLIAGGLIIRVGIIGYTIFGSQPNLTFFCRERRA